MDTLEHGFECPYCWRGITMVLDASVPSQSFIEDCENCCHPIAVTYTIASGQVVDFTAQKAQ